MTDIDCGYYHAAGSSTAAGPRHHDGGFDLGAPASLPAPGAPASPPAPHGAEKPARTPALQTRK